MRNDLIIGAVVLVAGIAVGLYFFLREPGIETQPAEVAVPAPAPVQESSSSSTSSARDPLMQPEAIPAPQPPQIPSLNESDAFVRESVAESGLPAEWLAREDLVRRVAVVMDNARKGDYPRLQLSFLAPAGKFEVIEDGERLLVNPANYARFDGFLDRLESVQPEALASWLDLFEPLISEALGEIGNEGDVNSQTIAAIDLLLAVPELDGDVELVQPKVFYEYADPQIEALKPLQKQVLRMGPDNVRRLKAYLTRLRAALTG